MHKKSKPVTEQSSNYDHLEKKEVVDLLRSMNAEDRTIPAVLEQNIPQMERIVKEVVARLKRGGRLFYLGAGTSGRLGIVDASEIPPTFGAPYDLVIGLIAGGDSAIRKAVEAAEDDSEQAWKDMDSYLPSEKDAVIGIAASGRTPYVIGGVRDARKRGLFTACITCNQDTELAAAVDCPVELIVGPEFVTGSTRMKAGTATKLALNMISTSVMIQLGRVKGNKMVDMQLTNQKLVERGTHMIMEETDLDENEAKRLLLLYGSVRKVLHALKNNNE
ncbi:MAG: N-acetylmuramic acid 6-phosphate etherase [Bacteroidales bacterium]|nr:N-acetylmuramic acid 6-phosphate etherase [Bacteroidales bacterium]